MDRCCEAGALAALLLVVIGGCLSGADAAITSGEVIEKVQEKLDDYKSFAARFEKRFYWAALDKSSSRQGRIYLRRPDCFRVEVDDGDAVVADGRSIWAYSRKNGQVIVSDYQGELKTPWEVLFDYTQSYVPLAMEEVKLEGRSCYLLTMKPQASSSAVTQMKVWVDRKLWFLLKLEQQEANDNVTTYILKDHRTNKRFDDDLFRFVPPDDVEVIDQRGPASQSD